MKSTVDIGIYIWEPEPIHYEITEIESYNLEEHPVFLARLEILCYKKGEGFYSSFFGEIYFSEKSQWNKRLLNRRKKLIKHVPILELKLVEREHSLYK